MRLIIESPAPHLKESLAYYQKLCFQCSPWEGSWLCQSKNLIIRLNPSPYSRPCINLFESTEKKIESSPSGTWVKQKKDKIVIPPSKAESILGNFGGVCLETPEIETSINFWHSKGFEGHLSPNTSWCNLKNKAGTTISLLKQTLVRTYLPILLSHFTMAKKIAL